MTDLHQESDDATPLAPDEREGLIPSHIVFRSELNEFEQQNILEAATWAFLRRRDPFNDAFARNLHRRMLGKVWRWAGTYRTTNKNLGVDRSQIQSQVDQALDNARFWSNTKTYSPDEIAVRFHHALVSIHPFPNGNGRWSRLMADIAIVRSGGKRFSWGGSSLRTDDETRRIYINALQAADNHDFGPLLAFARS